MIQHINWVQRLSSIVLHDVNVSLEDYIDTITTPGVPFDFVALVVLCRIYHIHVAVYTTQELWSTCHEKDIRQCLFGIIYNGEFQFSETVKLRKLEQYRTWLAQRFEEGKLPLHREQVKEEIALAGKLCTVPEALSVVNNTVLCKHATHTLLKEEMAEDSEKPANLSLKHSETSEYSDEDASLLQYFGIKGEQKEYSDENNNNVQDTGNEQCVKTENSEKSANDGNAVGTCDSSDEECEVLKCKELLQPSDGEVPPIVYSSEVKLEALWDNVDKCISNAQSAVSGPTTSTSTQNDVSVIEINEEDLLLTCPVCGLQETSQKKCVAYIAESHYDYRFKCKHCPKEFSNFNTKYRHERDHKPLKHICPVCAKGYPYKSELDRHMPVHSTVLPFPCSKCTRRFGLEKSRTRHEKCHENKSFVCSECDKVTDTQDKLYTHFCGAHGKGYNAKCGEHFQWPATRAHHQEKCTKCQLIIEQEEIVKEKRRNLNLASMSQPPKKKIKTEDSAESRKDIAHDALQETKRAIGRKLKTILELKRDL